MMDSRELILTYNASKKYVSDIHPELKDYFDEIWELFLKKEKMEEKMERKIGLASFVSDEIVVQIVQAIIPFVSATVSAVIANVLWKKIGKSKSTTDKIDIDLLEDGIKGRVVINGKLARKILPYILMEIERENSQNTKNTIP